METKEMEIMKLTIKNICYGEEEPITILECNEVLECLKRGKGFEDMWNDLKFHYGEIPVGEYVDILNIMTIVASKFFKEGEVMI